MREGESSIWSYDFSPEYKNWKEADLNSQYLNQKESTK